MLKNASEVTLVPKNFPPLKILNVVQSFIEYKVSVAEVFMGVNKNGLLNEKWSSRPLEITPFFWF
jgi:hypothetical protein